MYTQVEATIQLSSLQLLRAEKVRKEKLSVQSFLFLLPNQEPVTVVSSLPEQFLFTITKQGMEAVTISHPLTYQLPKTVSFFLRKNVVTTTQLLTNRYLHTMTYSVELHNNNINIGLTM